MLHTFDRFCRVFFQLSLVCTTAMFTTAAIASSAPDAFTQEVEANIIEIFERVTDQESLELASREINSLADYVSAHAGTRQFDAIVHAEAAREIAKLLLGASSSNKRLDLTNTIDQLFEHPEFMIELGIQISDKDHAEHVARISNELIEKRSAQVKAFPRVAAAIALVHDRPASSPYTIRINENRPVAARPLDIFDFYVNHASTMAIPLNKLPTALLVYVVDVSESIEDLEWAHRTYARNQQVGERFFEIEYDYDHYRKGTPKKVTQAGDYSLKQIKKHGGVCADQAYFAMSVAKANGIPSGYIVAKGANVSHAWVGFLEVKGRQTAWNFDAGRYPEYQKLRGNVTNPQTGERISDGRLGVLGIASSSTNTSVLHSMAIAKAVMRMLKKDWNPETDLRLDIRGNLRKPRTDSAKDCLALLKASLRKCAGSPTAWADVIHMSYMRELTLAQKNTWSKAVMQMCGKQHQDFSYDFLVDLINTIEDPNQQHEMWEWAFNQFRTRPDLAAGVRFMQGRLWQSNDNPEYAWIAYNDVITNFINEGPMVNQALSSMGKLLIESDKRDDYLTILLDAARRVDTPNQMGSNFARQSNYYKINWRLVKELEYHDQLAQASRIRKLINMPANE
ncbi:MAG: hypothetical protein JKX70_07115 [Phycisphaerales bacterium]|nr:hypothetical protein [Phycisphaerales bacterium]